MARALFPELPDNFDGISDEDLSALHADFVSVSDQIADAAQKDATPEQFSFVEGVDDVRDQMLAGVEAALSIKAELDAREQSAAEQRDEIAELAAQLKPPAVELAAEESETDTDSPATADEPEAPAELAAEPETETVVDEPIAAAATPAARTRRPLPRPSAAHQPLPHEPEQPTFVASADINGFKSGQRLESERDVLRALASATQAVVSTPPGFRQNVVVASLHTPWPEERRLMAIEADPEGFGNWDRIRNVTRPNGNIVAAGGVCAPVTPYYGQQFIATLDRPVRDAIVAFNADRGGIRFNPPIGIGTISGSDAIGIVTEAEDAEGGTFAAKSCLTVECVAATEVDVDIIFHCVTWSNLTARTFPERVAQFNDTVMAGWARLAETNLLNGIKAASTKVTQANTNTQGATSSLLGSVLTAAAGQRSRQRMPADATLRALFPAWSRDLLVADIVRSQFQRFDMSEAGLIALLRSYNVEPSFYLDGPSDGTAQVFGAQSAGPLETFPTDVQWALFPEGSFLFLDGGVLELGIVRDSVLNAENQFQIFGESFENVAFVGIESLWITTAVCPSGTVAAPKDNSSFCS